MRVQSKDLQHDALRCGDEMKGVEEKRKEMSGRGAGQKWRQSERGESYT